MARDKAPMPPVRSMPSAAERAFVERSPSGKPLKSVLCVPERDGFTRGHWFGGSFGQPARRDPLAEPSQPVNQASMSRAVGDFYHNGASSSKAKTPAQAPTRLASHRRPDSAEPVRTRAATEEAAPPATSRLRPDPSSGYTGACLRPTFQACVHACMRACVLLLRSGHRFAYRFREGEEDDSMAARIARRRRESVERRFSASKWSTAAT